MLDRLFGIKVHDYLQALGVFILAFGVPMNKVLMSIGTIWLASNLLLKADFKNDWKVWKQNTLFWFIFLIFLIHIIGLFYTQNFSYASNDLNAKLPLFVIPTVLIAFPVQRHFLKYILFGFLLSLLITSAINYNYMLSHGTGNYRDFSLFGSHIRYALLVVTGILTSLYLFNQHPKLWFIYLPLIIWFSYYTMASQVMSGYVAFLSLLIAIAIYGITKINQKSVRIALSFVMIALVFGGSSLIYQQIKPTNKDFNFKTLPKASKYGETYYNDTTSLWFENEHHVLSCIADKELKQAWNERTSSILYREKYSDGYVLKPILIRYMASKGLTKDKEGMSKMSQQDVENVESGISTIVKTYPPIKRQFSILKNELFQYSKGGDPNGNSLLQRFEHWKAAKGIIQRNWLFGVGTGDVQNAFNNEYENMHSLLDKENRNRAHNQFMTFWISFGIAGFVLFTAFWIWFLGRNIYLKNLFGIGFVFIAIGSFLSEDTIETQQGVTFIALFLGISEIINQIYTKQKKRKSSF